jgi:hypothetical protein
MTTPIAFPLINGLRHDWSSVELKANSQLFMGIKSIDYEWTREVQMVRGFSPDPIGQTRGTNDYTCSVEMYLAEWNLFLSQLGGGFGDAFFSIAVSFAENGFDQITDQIIGTRLVGNAANMSQGADPLTRKLKFMPTKIKYQGFDDLATPLTAPPTAFLSLTAGVSVGGVGVSATVSL